MTKFHKTVQLLTAKQLNKTHKIVPHPNELVTCHPYDIMITNKFPSNDSYSEQYCEDIFTDRETEPLKSQHINAHKKVSVFVSHSDELQMI